VVESGTRFGIVGVREPPQLLYACRQCAAEEVRAYGPFICAHSAGADSSDRVCDRHVVILDGALTANCEDHHPPCAGCGEPATFRCAGPQCNHREAWCDAHRRRHPMDTDLDFCPPCFDLRFPDCAAPGCTDVATVRCEIVDRAALQACGRPMCTRHARRWQVFGPERLGLGRCPRHPAITELTADDVLVQIVVGAASRKRQPELPRLTGLAHNLRKSGHRELALDYPRIHAQLHRVVERLVGRKDVTAAMAAADPRWRKQLVELAEAAEQGRRHVERLRELVRKEDAARGAVIADAICLAEFKPRAGLLFIRMAPEHRGRFIGSGHVRINKYRAELKIRIEFEEDRPTT
jgi:hypothetical protein